MAAVCLLGVPTKGRVSGMAGWGLPASMPAWEWKGVGEAEKRANNGFPFVSRVMRRGTSGREARLQCREGV